MTRRIFCIVLTVLLMCSFTIVKPKTAVALVVSSQGSVESKQNDGVVSSEELRARKEVGRSIQQLGYSPCETEARLGQLSQEDAFYLAENLSLIQQGGEGHWSEGEAFVVCALLVLAFVGIGFM